MAASQRRTASRHPGGRAARALVVDASDNVATVITAGIARGTVIRVVGARIGTDVIARTAVPFGHKVALRSLPRGASVIKYGLPIGRTTRTVRPGDHVHVHNLESRRGRGDLARRRAKRRS